MDQARSEAAFHTASRRDNTVSGIPPFRLASYGEAFSPEASVEAAARLHRLTRAFVQRDPGFGHVSGLRDVAVVMGLSAGEEISFWLLTVMMEDIRPEGWQGRSKGEQGGREYQGPQEAGLLAEVAMMVDVALDSIISSVTPGGLTPSPASLYGARLALESLGSLALQRLFIDLIPYQVNLEAIWDRFFGKRGSAGTSGSLSLVYAFLAWVRLATERIQTVLTTVGGDGGELSAAEAGKGVYEAMLFVGAGLSLSSLESSMAAVSGGNLTHQELLRKRREARRALEARPKERLERGLAGSSHRVGSRLDVMLLRERVATSRHEVGELVRRFGALHPVSRSPALALP